MCWYNGLKIEHTEIEKMFVDPKEYTIVEWRLNPGPFDHHADALLTVLGRYVLDRRFLKCTLFHAPLHILDFDHF